MATKKKGCGFLIAALVLLIIGGIIAGILGMSAISTGKEFAENIQSGTSFVTPGSTAYSATEDSEVTVWLVGGNSEDVDKVVVNVTDTSSNTSSPATKPSGSSTMGNQHLVGTFNIQQGKSYEVSATGAPAGSTLTIASVSSSAVLSLVGKSFGAFAAFGICGFIALILGIVGLVKFFNSKKEAAPAQV